MARDGEPVTIKKYANRRLYNTGSSTYVTLDDLALMVKNGEDFVVYDAKSGEDITRSVLTQIIVEQESRGPNLLPATFLRQLIRFYGDSVQALVPTYLDFSLDALKRDKDKYGGEMGKAFGGEAFHMIEDQVRRNAEMFGQAMRMFMPPFGTGPGVPNGTAEPRPAAKPEPKDEPRAGQSSDLDKLKRQLEQMQAQLDKLTDKG